MPAPPHPEGFCCLLLLYMRPVPLFWLFDPLPWAGPVETSTEEQVSSLTHPWPLGHVLCSTNGALIEAVGFVRRPSAPWFVSSSISFYYISIRLRRVPATFLMRTTPPKRGFKISPSINILKLVRYCQMFGNCACRICSRRFSRLVMYSFTIIPSLNVILFTCIYRRRWILSFTPVSSQRTSLIICDGFFALPYSVAWNL